MHVYIYIYIYTHTYVYKPYRRSLPPRLRRMSVVLLAVPLGDTAYSDITGDTCNAGRWLFLLVVPHVMTDAACHHTRVIVTAVATAIATKNTCDYYYEYYYTTHETIPICPSLIWFSDAHRVLLFLDTLAITTSSQIAASS